MSDDRSTAPSPRNQDPVGRATQQDPAVAEPRATPVADGDAPKHSAAPAADREPVVIEHPVRQEPLPAEQQSANAAPVVAAPVSPPAPASAPAPATEASALRTVYVEAPAAPKNHGNRGVGSLIAVLSALIYAGVYAAVAALVIGLAGGSGAFGNSFVNFLASPVFWVPVLAFAIALVLLVLIVNRAGWGAYIIGGFVVAVIVYFSYLGGALLTVQAWQYTPDEARRFLADIALSPLSLAAGIVAREVSIWAGAAIAARGRRVRTRNAEAKAAFERDTAARKAEYERANSGYSGHTATR